MIIFNVANGDDSAYYSCGYETREEAMELLRIAIEHDPRAHVVAYERQTEEERLRAEIEQVKRERDEAWKVVERISEQNELMAGALERLKRERDAAVNDLSLFRLCGYCRNDETKDKLPFACTSCGSRKSNWRWRGVQEGDAND